MTLPSFISQESWNGWIDMRKAMPRHIPLTERAKNIALHKLEEWDSLGYDCNFILDHATLSGWRGLYLPPEPPRRQVQQQPTSNAQQMSLVELAIKESQKTGRPADTILAELRRPA